MSVSLLEAIRSRAVVMDGAMGTRLRSRGLDFAVESPSGWCVTRPGDVRAVHREYVEAGAEVLVTNTFLAADADTRIAGVELARAEAGPGRFVLLDIGPVRGLPETASEARATLADLPPIDGVLLETFSDPVALTIAEAFAGCGVPVLLSLTFRGDGGRLRSQSGEGPEFFARFAASAGVAVLGVNCGREVSPEAFVEVLRCYREHTELPLLARPNSDGLPTAKALRDAGAVLIGGCCGTGPEWVREVAAL